MVRESADNKFYDTFKKICNIFTNTSSINIITGKGLRARTIEVNQAYIRKQKSVFDSRQIELE